MTKPELGNRHQCKRCGARFFDLNKSPITCPRCGTIFQAASHSRAAHGAPAADEDSEAGPVAELVSLEEADAGGEKVPAAADDDVEIEAADDDVGDLIDGEIGEEER